MPEPRRLWVHVLAAAIGIIVIVLGLIGLTREISLRDSFFAVLGFLLAGWAILDYRRFQRGTEESEVDGGHTIE